MLLLPQQLIEVLTFGQANEDAQPRGWELRDRWGSTPLDEAVLGAHSDVAAAIRAEGHAGCAPGQRAADGAAAARPRSAVRGRLDQATEELCSAAAAGDAPLWPASITYATERARGRGWGGHTITTNMKQKARGKGDNA